MDTNTDDMDTDTNMESETTSTAVLIELNGRLDSFTAPNLRSQITECLSSQPTNLILDLTAVRFIDSRALATIVQGLHACQATGGELCLSGPNESVRRILELTRLDKAIKIFSNKLEAFASYDD